MFIENELIRYVVGIAGLVCLLHGLFFLSCILLIAWVTVRLPRLEKMLAAEKDAHKQKALTRKISFWRAQHEGLELGAKLQGSDTPPEALLRALISKHPHFITKELLFCLIGIASFLWAFGFFGR